MKKIRKSSNKEAYEEGELIPGLPTCLAFDILSRIPSATELSGFKCVSKFWLKSLSDPYFLSLHRSRSDQNPPFYCFVPIPFDEDRPRGELDKEFDVTIHIQTADHEGRPINHFTKQIKAHEEPYLSLLPSKQLVCLSTSYRIYICNPSTQDFVELPKGSALPFCLYNVGFGYLPSSMEYKVVRLFYMHFDPDPSYHRLGCKVMTISRTCTDYSWRVMEEHCPYAVDEHGSITVNGFVVWEVESAFLLGEEEEDNEYILSFDLEKEKFGTVPPPRCRKKDGFGLAGLRSNLWFVDYGEGPLIMNVWMLKDWNTFEWLKQYSINFGGPEVWWARRPLDIIKLQGDDSEGEEVILVYARGKAHYYHVQSKSFTFLGDGRGYKFCYYHDSFFSLPRPI